MSDMNFTKYQSDLFAHFSEDQLDLLFRLMDRVHDIQYGSVTLTIHDGKVMEIQKTERIRVQK
jgi:hypothetical protein